MPFGDGTGPLGLGSGTGRKMGYCRSIGIGSFWNAMRTTKDDLFFKQRSRRIFGCYGRGRGWRNCFWLTGLPNRARGKYSFETDINEKDEVDILENQAGHLRKHLEWIENRLNAIKKSQAEANE